MTSAAWVLLACYGAVAAVDWVAVGRGSQRLEYLAKPGCMAFLIAAALVLDPEDGTSRALLVVALALSTAGDVFLMLPGRRPGSPGPDLFVAGLAAFLCAHLAYVGAFWIEGTEGGWALAGAVVAAAIALGIGRPVLAAVRRSAEPGLAGPVTAYVLVIAAMVLSAFATGEGLAMAGALAFAGSDGLIARERFIAQMRGGRLAIIVSYHAAQALLVLSFAA